MSENFSFLMRWGLVLAFAGFALSSAIAQKRKPGLYATLQTSQGTIVCELFEKEAPITVKNFTDLAEGKKPWKDPRTGETKTTPMYNGTIFHRVIPEFMIQGGDPTGTGTGSPVPVFKNETSPNLKFDIPGRLAMANAGPNTNSSQFFITEVPYPSLNGGYTIFGQLIEGADVVKKIARVPRDPNDKPRTPVVLEKLTIERVPAGGS